MIKAQLGKRLVMLEQLAAYEERASCAEAEQVLEQAFEHALGRTLDELDGDELDRVIQLLREAPDHAHPLLVRTCLTRPEDREPAQPAGKYCRQIPGQGTQWFTPDTDEWRIYSQWWRRRWGYLTAANDPEAQALCAWIEAWAVSPDRDYLHNADLRLLFARLGVDAMGYLELRRLVDLCAALDELAREQPGFEVPLEVYWSVLGWAEHHSKRQRSVPGPAPARVR